ncbi:adenosylcobinamide-phosphate synthase CbiB [Orenia marismortui]|uniref:adenosylcobinamide-phosphate synthase CbiB n=1 Tax=Orenia marismortui TaxID=46469 RepID=UPI0003746332|nr:adenosylcobinamide-phosphate synthase CbiB [Orenia marismortui]
MNLYLLLMAVLIDIVIGDPNCYPHPVIIIGRGISIFERILRRFCRDKLSERISGIILVLFIIVGSYLVTKWIIDYAYQINYHLGLIVNLFLLSTTIAIKGLGQAGKNIYHLLVADNLNLARSRLDWIVGRDTDNLDEGEIIRATIETIAENTSDGIIAPLFYIIIGAAPLVMAYKAVNTLDSMLGYKNEKYRYFGWAAARIDDIANFIPARITAFLFVIAALINRSDWTGAIRIIARDAKKHPSPNAGFPEGAVAGALGIRLGGRNYYHGRESFRAYLGESKVEFDKEQIKETISLMYWNVGLFLIVYYLFKLIIDN